MGFIEPDTTSKDKGKDGKKRFSFDDLEFDDTKDNADEQIDLMKKQLHEKKLKDKKILK
jgi:hypothetical protein